MPLHPCHPRPRHSDAQVAHSRRCSMSESGLLGTLPLSLSTCKVVELIFSDHHHIRRSLLYKPSLPPANYLPVVQPAVKLTGDSTVKAAYFCAMIATALTSVLAVNGWLFNNLGINHRLQRIMKAAPLSLGTLK